MGTLMSWKKAIAIIVGLFLAGVISIVSANAYVDARTEMKYYSIAKASALEQRTFNTETNIQEQNKQLVDIKKQQDNMIEKIGQMNGKLDILISRPSNKR